MFEAHRESFLAVLGREQAAAIVPTGSLRVRNHDCDHLFRPHSDFYWLTGFREPEAILVLTPHAELRTHLFLLDRDPERETWNGRRLGVELAPEVLGVDAAYAVEEFAGTIADLLIGADRIVYRFGDSDSRDKLMLDTAEVLRGRERRGERVPLEFVDPARWLHELRLFKDTEELDRMRCAADITAEGHRLAMAATRPERNECEIDALLSYTFGRRGSTGSAYNNIVAGGGNACILHYVENDQPLRDGDLLLIDAGAEWDYYASDVTRTFPVNGSFSAEQRELYALVLRAQKGALAAARPGATFDSTHAAAVRILAQGLLDLGILHGSLDEVLEKGTYRRFYMHRTGHFLGLDVHDCGALHTDGVARPFEPGMVLTVEPGLYIPSEDPDVDSRWRGIGIRIEDDILVTGNGHEILSAAVPKEIDAVEDACRAELEAVEAAG